MATKGMNDGSALTRSAKQETCSWLLRISRRASSACSARFSRPTASLLAIPSSVCPRFKHHGPGENLLSTVTNQASRPVAFLRTPGFWWQELRTAFSVTRKHRARRAGRGSHSRFKKMLGRQLLPIIFHDELLSDNLSPQRYGLGSRRVQIETECTP